MLPDLTIEATQQRGLRRETGDQGTWPPSSDGGSVASTRATQTLPDLTIEATRQRGLRRQTGVQANKLPQSTTITNAACQKHTSAHLSRHGI